MLQARWLALPLRQATINIFCYLRLRLPLATDAPITDHFCNAGVATALAVEL